MNKAEKENHEEIACLRELCKKFEKENEVRSILRVKALIAYYKGMTPEVIAECYEITQKTLKNWIKRFESDEQLDDFPRSGRPSKLPKEKQEELNKKGFESFPEVRFVLENHLDLAKDSSLAIRAVYGQWLPWLIFLDREWLYNDSPGLTQNS